MNSIILQVAARQLFWPLLVLSVVAMYRGHNLPGGGFIGGLLAASPFVLIFLADGVEAARKRLRLSPVTWMAIGLGVAFLGGVPAWGVGESFLTGLWLPTFSLPLLGTVHLGTPTLFDVGVFLTVIGFTTAVIFNLEDLD